MKFDADAEKRFLEALHEVGTIRGACRQAQVGIGAVNGKRNRDADFRASVELLLEQADAVNARRTGLAGAQRRWHAAAKQRAQQKRDRARKAGMLLR